MAVQLTYHGSPYASNILQEGFKASKPVGGFSTTWASPFQSGAKAFSSPNPNVAKTYGNVVKTLAPTSNLTSPVGGGITKSSIALGKEIVSTPSQFNKGMNIANKLGVKSTGPFTGYTGSTAARLAAGETVAGLGGATTSGLGGFLGGQIAMGLPLGYAALADALQGRLEEQGLTGEGGIYDISGGWGAMGAGADIPIIQKMLADRRATQKGIADANMQRKIQEAEAAQAQAAAAQQVRQNIQTYGNRDRPNTGMNRPGGGRGQSPTGGDVSGTPFSRGGLATMFQRR